MNISYIITIVLLFGSLACVEIENEYDASFDIDDYRDTIVEQTDAFSEAHVSRDTLLLNNIFSEDARVFPPGTNMVSGSEDIARLNALWVSFNIKEFNEVSSRMYGFGEYIVDEGEYDMIYGDDDIVDNGKYLNVWKEEDGEWKLYANIWNGNGSQ